MSGDHKTCRWPPTTHNAKRAISSKLEPPKIWKKLDVKLIFFNDSLDVVRSKCNKYLQSSNIDSSEDDDEDTSGLHKLRKRAKQATILKQCEFTLGPMPEASTHSTEQQEERPSKVSNPQNELSGPPAPTIELHFVNTPTENHADPIVETPRRPSNLQQHSIGALEGQFSVFETYVLRKLEKISQDLKDVKKRQTEMSAPGVIARLDIPDLPDLPLKSIADLEKFSLIVETSSEIQNRVAIFLSRIGGTDVKDAAERVLGSFMKNDVALLFNWAGKKFKDRLQKLPIRSTGVPAVVCRAVEAIVGHGADVEVEECIKVWLRNTKSRMARK